MGIKDGRFAIIGEHFRPSKFTLANHHWDVSKIREHALQNRYHLGNHLQAAGVIRFTLFGREPGHASITISFAIQP